jgi:hypothetical protein
MLRAMWHLLDFATALFRDIVGRASSTPCLSPRCGIAEDSANSRPFIPKGIYPRRSIQVAGESWTGHGGSASDLTVAVRPD